MKLTSLTLSEELAVSHNPLIKKRVLIAADEIAGITNFSRAVFPPGEVAPLHCHKDMAEVFYIESGQGEIEVDGAVMGLSAGSCIRIDPDEAHELRNTSDDELVVIYFGAVSR